MKKQQQEVEEVRVELTDEEIKTFERKLEDYKQSVSLDDKELSYYGELLNQERFEGYVRNQVLGGIHWSVVKYCMEEGIIKRHKDGSFAWLIAYEDEKRGKDTILVILDCPFKKFMPLWKGLKDLKSRRLYAQDMEAESLGFNERDRVKKILAEGRQRLYEKLSWINENPL